VSGRARRPVEVRRKPPTRSIQPEGSMNEGATPQNPPVPRNKRYFWLAVRLLLLGAAATYAVWGIDLRGLLHSFQTYPLSSMLCAAWVSLLAYAILALRIRWMVTHAPPLRICLASVFLCLGANNLFPARAGELMKAIYLSRRLALPLPQTLGFIFWERLFDLTLLLSLGAFALPGLDVKQSLMLSGSVILAVWGGLLLLRLYPKVFLKLAGKIPFARLTSFLERLYQHAVADITPRWLGKVALATGLVWLAYAGINAVSLLGVARLPLSLEQVIAVCVIGALGVAVPASPGGLGMYEAAVVFALAWFGVPKAPALGIAFFMHALTLIPTSLAALWILHKNYRLPQSSPTLNPLPPKEESC
jgi:glycosyltransferase 2 family protein